MTLEPDSYSFDLWKELPIPLYMQLYFFNVTNYKDIENRVPGAKPILEEVGPYTWRQYQTMVNISWNDANDTITYMQNKWWEWQPDMSNGTLDDIIAAINVVALVSKWHPLYMGCFVTLQPKLKRSVMFPLQGASEYARKQPEPFYAYTIDEMFDYVDAKLFLVYPVRNFTFDGIVDEIMAGSLTMNVSLPIPFDKFGWFYDVSMLLIFNSGSLMIP